MATLYETLCIPVYQFLNNGMWEAVFDDKKCLFPVFFMEIKKNRKNAFR